VSTAKAPSLSVAGISRARAKILVIDDEQSMRELLIFHLRKEGYDVLAAEDAVAAGHLVVRHKPDLLIVDVQMPYMNGYDFVAAVKSDPDTKNIPVLFLTSDEDVRHRARQVGAAAYLRKPVTADRLLQVVEMFLPE
jgi:CheY-like chemotaxis protein